MAGLDNGEPASGHRPLKAVKSAAGRLQDQGINTNDEKVKSLSNLSRPSELLVSSIEHRRRSRSAPLTLEATNVANELTRLSDILTMQYTVKKRSISRIRRHTFGSPNDKEQERRSFHFDYKNYEELSVEFNTISEETPDFQRGTSV